ncbi:hypothetical protein B0H13DRAFT_1964787 [Mycena leptocephala]|nr:hypothetical protein B0H13DRAFT_1964787 [Mycena leptocephala]
MTSKTDVATQNQRLFAVFKLRLSSTQHYVAVAEKLGKWLANDKAYYPEARPQVIPSIANAFIALILCVAPYQHHFVEPDLQASVRHLLATIARLKAPASDVAAPSVSDTVQDRPFPSTVIEPSQQMRPSSSSLASALTPTTPTASNTNRALTNPPQPSKEEDSNQVISPSVPVTQPPVVSQTDPVSSVESGSASTPAVSTIKLSKRKKKKKDDLANLIQADVERYYQKKGTIQKPAEDAQTLLLLPRTSSKLVEVTQSTTSPVVPSTVEDTPMRAESKAKEPNSTSERIDIEMTDPTDPHVQAASSASAVEPAISSAPAVASEPLPSAMDDEVNRMTGPIPSSDQVGIAGAVDPGVVNSDEAMPPVSHDPPITEGRRSQPEAVVSSDNTSLHGVVDMDVDTQTEELTRAPQPNEFLAGHPVDPAALQEIIQNVVNNVNRLIASDAAPPRSSEVFLTPSVTDGPPLDAGEFSTIDLPIPPVFEDVHLEEDITPSTKTGIEAATVIAQHRGLPSGTITINFSINQDQLDSITKWNDRSKHSDDIRESLCITLLCFAMTGLESSPSKDLHTLLPELECSWPKTGGLSMNALWNGQRTKFPMSPPFALPANGLVDVSPFLVLGNNLLHITQTRDMSKYWLLLCAHHPTPSQINAVARRRHKERNWTGWLEKISQPFQLPFRIPVKAS